MINFYLHEDPNNIINDDEYCLKMARINFILRTQNEDKDARRKREHLEAQQEKERLNKKRR